jgi:hypothetical protein
MKNIFWFMVGSILILVGKLAKKSHIHFLGYYLQGRGKERCLPVYTYPLLEYELRHYGLSHYKPYTFINPMLFHTIGKAWVKQNTDNKTFIKDVYKFYPICSEVETHFSDCDCEDKQYSDISILSIKIPEKYQDKIFKNNRYHKNFKIGEHIKACLTKYYFSMEVNDEYWINKGKEFNIYTELNIPLKKSSYTGG